MTEGTVHTSDLALGHRQVEATLHCSGKPEGSHNAGGMPLLCHHPHALRALGEIQVLGCTDHPLHINLSHPEELLHTTNVPGKSKFLEEGKLGKMRKKMTILFPEDNICP